MPPEPGPPAPPGGIVAFPVTGLGEIGRGDDIARLVCARVALQAADVVVVTQKAVSKSEGKLVALDPDDPAALHRLVESESVRVLRRRGDLVISDKRHGYVCANAGVDVSNVAEGWAALLPDDPDRSARRIRDAVLATANVEVGVIVSDTFGRAWRRGVVDVAIGCAGVAAVVDLRGTPDALGRELQAAELGLADELAAAAELAKGKAAGVPVAVVRGVNPAWFRRSSAVEEIIRPPAEDLFR